MPIINIPYTLCQQVVLDFTPNELDTNETTKIRTVVKSMIVGAIDEDLTPLKVPDDLLIGTHQNFSFKQSHSKRIMAIARKSKTTESKIALGYLLAAMEKGSEQNYIETDTDSGTMLKKYTDQLGFAERPHQTILFSYLQNAIADSKVGIVEGSTGVGKTLSITASANETALLYKASVCISTNSIETIKQFALLYNRLQNTKIKLAPLQVIIGRPSFVSEEKLNTVLDDTRYDKNRARIIEWLANGGMADEDNMVIKTPFLLSDLAKVAPEIIQTDVALGYQNREDDRGFIAYKQQFDRDVKMKGGIILCTHTMLAIDAQTRRFREQNVDDIRVIKERYKTELDGFQKLIDVEEKPSQVRFLKQQMAQLLQEREHAFGRAMDGTDIGLIPNYDYLYVDEAHLLEEAVSNAIATSISLNAMARQALQLGDTGIIPKTVGKEIKSSLDDLSELGKDISVMRLALHDMAISSCLKRVSSAILGCRSKNKDALSSLVRDAKAIDYGLRSLNVKGHYTEISFSPIRRYPQLLTGNTNTRQILASIWHRVRAAACISASLYIKKKDTDCAEYYKNILNINASMAKEYAPVTPPWVKSPIISFIIPEYVVANGRQWLRPPSRSDRLTGEDLDNASKLWAQEVAEVVVEAHTTGQGGVLVLMTSFNDVENIFNEVKNKIPYIVKADADTTLQEQKAQFLAMREQGEKALWFAVGAAWTGLDISGAGAPLDDDILTDLIIPKIPFGANMSLSHSIRRQSSFHGSTIEALETYMRFKQGIGRLVRREGLRPNRRIWVLDGRLSDPNFKGMVFNINKLISSYHHVTNLEKR